MAVKTQFTDLYFIDPADDSIVKVACITSLTGITADRGQIDVSCMDSVAFKYLAGMANPGQAQFGIFPDPSEPSHVRLHELYKVGTVVKWATGWSDGTAPPTADTDGEFVLPTTRSWLAFDGSVNNFPFDFAINSAVTSQLSLQLSGFPEWVVKV